MKRQEWLKRANDKRKAMETGTFSDAPITAVYVPKGQEWMAISLWGPQGPYARSNENTVLFHGAFPTPEEADAHVEELKTKVPTLKYVQTVVFQSGNPIPMPLKPTGDINRKFPEAMKQVEDQWNRYSQYRLAEEQEMKQRVMLAKQHYKAKDINIKNGIIEKTTAPEEEDKIEWDENDAMEEEKILE